MICGQGTSCAWDLFSQSIIGIQDARGWREGPLRFDGAAGASFKAKRPLGVGEGALNSELKSCKRTLRILLRTAYSGERLDLLLAHSRSGQVDVRSCCHFLGG